MIRKVTGKKAVAKALEGSIDKWQKIVDYFRHKQVVNWELVNALELGSQNCPLCQLFPFADCGRCPVALKTNKSACGKTPYVDFVNAKALQDLKLARAEAKAELEFLKTLRV